MKRTFIFLSILLALSGCSKPPEKLEEAGRSIIKINDPNFIAGQGTMVIDVKANTLWSLASDSEAIFKDIKQYFPSEIDKYEKIWVFGNTDLVDKYGNKSVDRTFGVEWSTSELKKANLDSDSFTTFDLLNLASDVRGFNRVGHDFFVEYCKDEGNMKYTRNLCATYAIKYMR